MGKDLSKVQTTFFFCEGSCCQKAGSSQVIRVARAYLRNEGLWDSTHTIKTRCNGRCEDAPTCAVFPQGVWHKALSVDNIEGVLQQHVRHQPAPPATVLYGPTYVAVQSDNSIPLAKLRPFVLRQATADGACYMTRGFHSDQYIYPLFLFLVRASSQATLQLPTGAELPLAGASVDYSHAYRMQLCFDNKTMELIIGAGSTAPDQLRKIHVVEYFLHDGGDRRIVLKNKQGDTEATVRIPYADAPTWSYCLRIQLRGVADPTAACHAGLPITDKATDTA